MQRIIAVAAISLVAILATPPILPRPRTSPAFRASADYTSHPGAPQGYKIPLRPDMVINEVAAGDAGALVDEQSAAGDPRSGRGGTPEHPWQPGYRPFDYPASAVIDLGAPYHLSAVYLYDGTGTGRLTVSAGVPFAWKPLFEDPLTAYNVWVGHDVNVNTRYLQFTFQSPGAAVNEIVLYGSPLGSPIRTETARPHPPQPPMAQFIGVNGFIDDPPERLAHQNAA